MKSRILWCAAVLVLMGGSARAQTKDPWIGKFVYMQAEAVMKIGDRVIEETKGGIAASAISKTFHKTTRSYRVDHEKESGFGFRNLGALCTAGLSGST